MIDFYRLPSLPSDQREHYDATQGKIGYLAGQVAQITDTINSLAEAVADVQSEAERKTGLLEKSLRQEREARESLAAQVATLLQKKQSGQPRKRGAALPSAEGQGNI